MVTPLILRRPLRPSVDAEGRQIILVPLSKTNAVAKASKEAIEMFRDLGLSLNWTLSEGRSVRVRHGKFPNLSVARLIAKAPMDARVMFKDKNSLNLLPDNLVLKKGRCFGHEEAVLEELERLKRGRLAWEARYAGMTSHQRFLAELDDLLALQEMGPSYPHT